MTGSCLSGIQITIPGLDPTWAGDCPWTGTRAFGSESGYFALISDAGTRSWKVTEDAINGVAFNGPYAAFSSRESLRLARQRWNGKLELDDVSSPFEGGAHGVIASSMGGFIAPAGPSGLLLLHQGNGESSFEAKVAQNPNNPLYVYGLASAGSTSEGLEVIVAAARTQGIVVFEYRGQGMLGATHGLALDGEDIVAVRPLNTSNLPRGLAALSKEGKIFFFRDAVESAEFVMLDYPVMQKTCYDLIAAHGHLVALTRDELIIFTNLVSDFASGTFRPRRRTNLLATNAAALYPAGVDGVYLIRDERVDRYSVLELARESDESSIRTDPCVVPWKAELFPMDLVVA